MVQQVQFFGRVYPSIVKINFEISPFPSQDRDFQGSFALRCIDNVLTIDCEVRRFTGDFASEVFRRALDYGKSAIDMMSFCEGLYITLVIDHWNPNGVRTPLIVHQPEVGALCTSYRLGSPKFAQVYNLILREPEIGVIMRDVAETTVPTNRHPASYGRAVEGIRHLIAPGMEDNRSEAWKRLHRALNVTHNYIKPITEHATPQRHGQNVFIPVDEMERVVRRSRIIVDRFLQYRLGGNQDLTHPAFPVLG